MTKTWWVARDKYGFNAYIVSREKPYKRDIQPHTTEAKR